MENNKVFYKESKEESNQNVQEKIIKEDKKAGGLFAIMMIASLFVGFLLGFGMIVLMNTTYPGEEMFLSLWEQLQEDIAMSTRYILIGFDVIAIIIAQIFVNKGKRDLKSWDGEDDIYVDKVEKTLSLALGITSISFILNFLFFAIAVYMIPDTTSSYQMIVFFATIFVYLASVFVVVFQQKKIINLEKCINPEKNGSIFDLKFKDKWLNSCDEAEKLKTYKASYKAFTVGQNTCVYVLLFFMLASMFLPIGFLPAIAVCIIWLVMTVVYLIESMKNEKL